MKVYKLTDSADQTHGGCQWGDGITHETDGSGDLCGKGWLHAYADPLLAVLHNPIHGNFDLTTAHLWECEAECKIKDDCGLKLGCTRLTAIKRIDLPRVTTEQRIEYGIRCALCVYDDPGWVEWANKWLSGEDRSEAAARAAMRAARAAAAAVVEAAWAVRAAAAKEPLDLISIAREVCR